MTDTPPVDPVYEYNAPQFVDFNELGANENENVEDYFNFDHENAQPVAEAFDEEMYFTPQVKSEKSSGRRKNTPRSCRSTPKRAPVEAPLPQQAKENVTPPEQQETANSAMDVLKKATESGMPTIKPVLSNLCTDLNAWRSAKPTINNVVNAAPSKMLAKAKKKSIQGKSAEGEKQTFKQKRMSEQSPDKKRHKRSDSTTEPKKLTRSNSMTVPKKHTRTNSQTQQPIKHQRTVSNDVQKTRNHARSTSVKATAAKAKEPTASTSQTRTRTNSVNRSKKEASFDFTAETQPKPKPSKLTVPATPSFMKRKAVGAGAEKQTMSTEQIEMEKIRQMQQDMERRRKQTQKSHQQTKMTSSYVPKHASVKPTQAHEFKFATDERLHKEHGMETRQDKEVDFVMQLRHNSPAHEHKPLGPTRPKPFEFHDRKRKRNEEEPEEGKGYQYKSMAEKMIAFAKKTPDRFRMRPKNTEMCHNVEKAKLTVPKTPQLASRKRHRPVDTKSHEVQEEELAEEMKRYKFHAQPVNEEMFKKQIGVKKVPAKELTKPVQIEMETDRRLATRHENNKNNESQQEAETSSSSRTLRAKPYVGVPFIPKFEHKITEPKPFSFDEKDRDRFAKKEEKIRHVVEEERKQASDFRAQPIPDLSPSLPARHVIPATQPEPFNFQADNRGSQKAEEWNQKLKEELRQQRAAAHFTARPNTVVHKKAFIPHKSNKPLTDLGDLELNTERRAEKRAEYDAVRHEHELEADEIRRQRERMQEEEEKREVERQRSAAVHKAQPIKKFRKVDVKPSDRPLTQPKTPKFSTRLRKHNQSNDETF